MTKSHRRAGVLACPAATRGMTAKRRGYACPASFESMPGSMPILRSARTYFSSTSSPKIRSGSASQCSQPLSWISVSSWPGRPAGVAEREDRVLGPGALRDRLEDVDGRGQADTVVDPQRRVLDEEVAGMQHEAAAGFDRAAAQHLHALGIFRQLDLIGLLDDVELHQQFREIDAAGRTIDDDAHRAFGRMRAEINHRALEARSRPSPASRSGAGRRDSRSWTNCRRRQRLAAKPSPVLLPSGSIGKGLSLSIPILILGGGLSIKLADASVPSQAIQWFAPPLACKDAS